MLSRRNVLEVAILAMPLAVAGCGDIDSRMATNIRGQRPKVNFLTDYQRAVTESRETNKPLLVVVKTRWCRFSRELLRDSFTSRHVVDASRAFVCLLVDADEKPELCERLRAKDLFPSMLYVNPSGTLLHRVEGRRTSKQLVGDMKIALAQTTRRPLAGSTR